jgi:hypothetical protein
MSNPLTDILPPAARKTVYFVYALIGFVFGAIQVGYGAAPHSAIPAWLKIALAVYAFVGTAIGATAASNVAGPPQ